MPNPIAEHHRRRALGRGLEALLPSRPTAPAAPSESPVSPRPAGDPSAAGDSAAPMGAPVVAGGVTDAGDGLMRIPVDQIERSPFQTRTQFNQAALKDLADSIRATGVVQPVLVRRLDSARFQLIAGERRWLASKLAGETTVPAIVRPVSEQQAMEITIVENLQRSDLNPMEQARAFDRLAREYHLTQEKMAQRTGKDRASIANFLRLLRLPSEVQKQVEDGELSFGHARTILALESPEEITGAAQKIVALSMSVRQAENYVSELLHPVEKPKPALKVKEPLDPNVREARDRLQRALGLKVRIEDRNGHGRVIIEYARLEDFDTLLETFARDEEHIRNSY